MGADDPLLLNDFVITAVSRPDKSKIQSSVSVSSLSTEKLDVFTPRNTAELFRSLPGIRVESTSGEGNANLTIRGIPLSDGGSRYLQIQEDGLPIVEFGDIAFGNADVFFRADQTIGNIESIRGGSAAIFASNSPGGVINMISKDGRKAGGSLAFTYGVDFDQVRTEFNYGSPIAEGLRFNVGGFYRSGEGSRTTGTTDGGGQVKFNLTKDLGGNGFVRVYAKVIDDTAPTYMPAPAKVNGTSSYSDLPGYDVLTGSLYSPSLQSYQAVDSHGNFITRKMNGIHVKVASIGAELQLSPGEDLVITNRVKVTSQSAQWGAPFPASVRTAADAVTNYAGTFAGATNLVYASGPKKGTLVANDALVTTIHSFDTNASDMGWMGNDLKVNKFFNFEGGKIDFTVGYYKSQQKIVQDWTWGAFLMETKGENASLLNLVNGSGTALTSSGHLSYSAIDWGNFAQTKDLQYNVDAPVVSVTYQAGPFSLDAGVRRDTVKARGTSFNSSGTVIDAASGLAVPVFNHNAAPTVNYEFSYTSYSFGGNYSITKDLALFARYSLGGRAGADRLAGNAGSDGVGFQAKSFYYDVKQWEAGVKYRTKSLSGIFNANATVFGAKTREPSGAELNKVNPPINYDAFGIELEGGYHVGGFDIRGNCTYTNAEGSVTGFTAPGVVTKFDPRRQASFIYTIAPSYTIGKISFGGSAIGTTESYFSDPAHGTKQDDKALKMPAYYTVNAYLAWQITKEVSLSLNANNLLDSQGWTEGEEGSLPGLTGNYTVMRARTIPGLTTSATLKYVF